MGGGGWLISKQMLTIKVVTLKITMYRHNKEYFVFKTEWLGSGKENSLL